jgi:serine/threonine protein kinase/tetratricopeptide (TPR) repeat protein
VMESPRLGSSDADGEPPDEHEADEFLREVARVETLDVPSPHPLIGHSIGRFRVLAELGRGGMGIVYLAHDASLQRSVALKLLRPSLSRRDERHRRFLREARAAASVTHPHLATIYDVGEVDGHVYIAMERLDGTSLRRVLARGLLPFDEAVRLALQILAGLAEAHRAGFVHRDLKPDNVMVTANGTTKLLDFGLAKRHRPGARNIDAGRGVAGDRLASDRLAGDRLASDRLAGDRLAGDRLAEDGVAREGSADDEAAGGPLDSAEGHTRAGQLLGTPSYMSPEQVRGAAIDPRSDIFSFGVLFFEMLAGVRPFAAESPAELQSAILRDTPRPLGELRDGVPPLLERVVERCLHKEPALRYESCEAISQELAGWKPTSGTSVATSRERGVADPRVALGSAPRTGARRRRVLTIAVSAALGLAALPILLRSESREPRSVQATSTAAVASRAGAAAATTAASREAGEAASRGAGEVASRGAGEAASREAGEVASREAPFEPVPVTALPLPESKSPEALAAYAAAMQATRDGNWGYVTTLLQRAVTLDPTLTIAHLRLAMYQYGGLLAREGRSSFGRAILGRASLNERDRALLEAFEPLFRDPPDPREVLARLGSVTERFPNDAEFHSLLAMLNRDAQGSLRAAQRSVELDPRSADGWQFLGESLFRLGDTEGALRALDHCVAISPAAADCRAQRGSVYSREGRCVEMDDDFRAALAGSRSLIWQNGRAGALFALGRPVEASLEIYQSKWSQLPEDTRAVTELLDRSNLNLAIGDFRESERQTLTARRLITSDADGSIHGRLALQLVQLYDETGRVKDAGRVADDYLKRKAGWIGSALLDEPSMAMHWAMLRANLLTREAFLEKRDELLRDIQQTTPGSLRSTAFALYATGVETEAEALEALSLFPDLDPKLEAHLSSPLLGRLHVLTGRAHDALPHLEKTARSCSALFSPVEYVRASFYLGQAEEAVGDTDAACAAYGNVLARWGKATLPSRTARKARARSAALGCKVVPKTTRTL